MNILSKGAAYLAFASALCWLPASATDYFVSPGAPSSGPCSTATPCDLNYAITNSTGLDIRIRLTAGTYEQAFLPYGKSMSLLGAGNQTTTLSGACALDFQLTATLNPATVAVSDVTLDGQSAGSGVCILPTASVDTTISLTRVHILHTTGAGLSAQSGPAHSVIVRVFDSDISNNTGRGIFFNGSYGSSSLRLERSLISYNVSGGVRIDGIAPATIANSTIIGNQSSGAGTAIDDNSTGTLDIINTTIEEWASALSTLYATSATLDHSILVGTCAGATVAGIYSVESPGNTCGLDANSWVSVSDIHLNLGPLADNGGPTQTAMPQAGSVAIGIGGGCQPVDQRDFVSNGICDAGAVQTNAVLTDEIFQNGMEIAW